MGEQDSSVGKLSLSLLCPLPAQTALGATIDRILSVEGALKSHGIAPLEVILLESNPASGTSGSLVHVGPVQVLPRFPGEAMSAFYERALARARGAWVCVARDRIGRDPRPLLAAAVALLADNDVVVCVEKLLRFSSDVAKGNGRPVLGYSDREEPSGDVVAVLGPVHVVRELVRSLPEDGNLDFAPAWLERSGCPFGWAEFFKEPEGAEGDKAAAPSVHLPPDAEERLLRILDSQPVVDPKEDWMVYVQAFHALSFGSLLMFATMYAFKPEVFGARGPMVVGLVLAWVCSVLTGAWLVTRLLAGMEVVLGLGLKSLDRLLHDAPQRFPAQLKRRGLVTGGIGILFAFVALGFWATPLLRYLSLWAYAVSVVLTVLGFELLLISSTAIESTKSVGDIPPAPVSATERPADSS